MTAFLLDGMLEGLARRLRLLGYDCRMIGPATRGERDILAHARAENRLVLTVSARRAGHPSGLFLQLTGDDTGAQVRAVVKQFPIDFRHLAFTRCSLDNTPLDEVEFASVAADLPPHVRELSPAPIRRCPACGRLYWPGTHTRRLCESFRALGVQLD